MKHNYFRFLIISLLFISIFNFDLNAQWQKMGSPSGGYIQCFTVKDNIIYTGTADNGLYYSSDNGVLWSKFSNSPGINIKSLAVNDIWIFVICDKGFFRSNNNGIIWEELNVGSGNRDIRAQNGILYLNDPNGIYMSNNNGLTWTLFSINQGAYGFSSDTNTVLATTWGANIFVSNDQGNSWQSKSLPYYVRTSTSAVYNNKLYVGTAENGVYVSSNGGDSWQKISIPLMSGGFISYIGVKGNTIYVCSDTEGVFVSSDNGLNWNKMTNGIRNLNFNTLCFSGNKIFAGTYTGIYASSDNGVNWNLSDFGIKANIITAFAENKNKYFAGTKHGLYASQDNGQSWQVLSSDLFYETISSIFVDNDNIYVGTTDGVIYSSNNGLTWVGRGLQGLKIYNFAKQGNNILAATNGGLYLSNNLGVSWTRMTTGNPDFRFTILINNGIVYTGGAYGADYSEDNCKTWKSWKNLTDNTGTSAIYLLNSLKDIYIANSGRGLLVSTNRGVNWQNTNIIAKTITKSNDQFFIGTSNGLLTSANGIDFNKLDTLTTGEISVLENYNEVIYACVNSFDLWLYNKVTSINNTNKKNFLIYPNPANNQISVNTFDTDFSIVKIIDITGKVIVSSKLNKYINTLNVSNITDGIYIIEVDDNNGMKSTNKLKIQHF